MPELLFTLLVYGAFAVAFIPVLSEPLVKDDREEAWKLTSSLLTLLAAGTVVVAAVVAPLNSNGTVGAWNITASLMSSAERAGVAVSNGYLYMIGGDVAGFASNTSQFTAIGLNGMLEGWVSGGSTFSNARYNQPTVVWRGQVYILGGAAGASNNTLYTDIQYAPLNSIARTAQYSRLFDLGASGVMLDSIGYNGILPGGSSQVDVETAPNATAIFSTTTPSLTGGGNCRIGLADTIRYVWVGLTLDDSQTAVFPDSAGPDANVTDFTVYYSPGRTRYPTCVCVAVRASTIQSSSRSIPATLDKSVKVAVCGPRKPQTDGLDKLIRKKTPCKRSLGCPEQFPGTPRRVSRSCLSRTASTGGTLP